MKIRAVIESVIRPSRVGYAHCGLPCGVYDPAQARIEAESIRAIQQRYQNAANAKGAGETVEDYKTRALKIKEERAEMVRNHLWILWSDYFKPEHLAKYPNLHELFWAATKEAAAAKQSEDPAQGEKLLAAIGEIDKIFWETKKA